MANDSYHQWWKNPKRWAVLCLVCAVGMVLGAVLWLVLG